jgi:ComF family protein
MYQIKSSVTDFVHLFFPHVCTGCGSDVLNNSHQLCLRCLSELPVTNFFSQPGNPVEKKFYGRLPVRNAGSGFFFTKDSIIETLVYELKYKGNKDIGFYLGQLVGKFLAENNRFEEADMLIPLPLNAKRHKKRGYNQASALCNGIASVWKIPVMENAVIRKVNTETQTHRGRITRWENMEGVFAVAEPSIIQDKHILLVDDIITTGASLEACGSEILKVPGTALSIATLGYTV